MTDTIALQLIAEREKTTLQKLNWLSKRGWQLAGKCTGKVFYKIAPFRKFMSINDAIRLEERSDILCNK